MSTKELRTAIDAVVDSFVQPFVDDGDALFAASALPWLYAQRKGAADITGIEATVNTFHIRHFTDGAITDKGPDRRSLMKLGRALIQVWSARLQGQLQQRTLLFYLGGRDEVLLRFHVERPEVPNWTDISDSQFFRRRRLEVYRATATSVERIA